MVTYTAAKLKLAHTIQRAIESLDKKIVKLTAKLNKVLEIRGSGIKAGGRTMSAAGRKAIADAQKRRWAKMKGKAVKKKIMSASARAKIAAAAKLRWKKAKAAGKNRL